jgi:hypothetical protein
MTYLPAKLPLSSAISLAENETPSVLSNETLNGHTTRRGAHG